MNTNLLITAAAATTIGTMAAGCTGQLPGSFRLAQQEQAFSSQQEINTKIDLLWVVDNSASMDVSQRKLRDGFTSFAARYMKPTWDIRVAVITTDTYMANSAFTGYLNTTIPGTGSWRSTHIQNRIGTFVNPSWNPALVNLSTARFDAGVRYGELVPVWGPYFAQLLPGAHDGPIPALCSELLPYFIRGVSLCPTRDDQTRATGISKCLNPGAGESSLTECVNTVQNDTVRSGRPIIETLGASPTQLAQDFLINVSTGSVGQGSERGLGSVLQLIADNEPTATAFFRAGSLRGIVFVSDEEDQTLMIPSTVPSDFKPQSNYRCDQVSLAALNGGSAGTLCCAGGGCSYGSEGTSCSPKTIDGFTYTVSVCPRDDLLMPVAEVKTQLDTFFSGLDGAGATPNYFVAAIVPLTGQAIQDLQAARGSEDIAVGMTRTWAVDRGDRYIELGTQVGNGSMSMNIAENDYTPILDAIGRAIIDKKSTFPLGRVPTSTEDMIVKVKHADGSSDVVPSSKFVISGRSLVITDQDFVLSLAATDVIVINYQPKSLY